MTDLNATADRIVRQDVHLCLSSMVATLGGIFETDNVNAEMNKLHAQAQDLCAPVTDYEEAAREAGWELSGSVWTHPDFEDAETSADNACYVSDAQPYEWEVYEHWAVSTWLAEKLIAAGERVDTDFAGLNVWARCTTGQAISMDAVIQRIAADVEAAR